jgi:glucose-1-phosphate thymidylyltransferase
MKAVVLSGGHGTRLRPLTYSMPKQLIPVGGQPVLGYVFDDIVECGITEVVVITSPESRGPVGEFVAGASFDLDFTFVVQDEPNGLAAAFGLAVPYLDGGPSLLMLGDCLLTGGIKHLVDDHKSSGAAATILVREVDDPSRYGIVEIEDGRIVALLEKPADPPTNLAIVGVYAFGPEIAASVSAIAPSARGEYEITDAIQHLVDSGGQVRPAELNGWWIDTGTVEDVLVGHQRILDDRRDGPPVDIHPTASVTDCELVGPVVVDAGATLTGSTVGPFTHVGAGATVEGSVVTNSILMSGSRVGRARVRQSILGRDARFMGDGGEGWHQFVLGSDAVVESQAHHSG